MLGLLCTPKEQTGVFSQWPLELNQNKSDIWLEYIKRTFERMNNATNIIKKTSFVCSCWLVDTRNISLDIIHYIYK